MAIDGSFCMEFEFRRFLARCPKLSSDAQLSALSEKLQANQALTEEEVVNAVAELFCHPSYTIPLVGCYRAVAPKIIDKAVSILRLVPNLRSDVSDAAGEDIGRSYEDGENIRIINFLVQKGCGLHLHELTCFALCRALDLVPSLLGCVMRYFEFAPPPFERICSRRHILDFTTKAQTHLLLSVVRVSYRILLIDAEVFIKQWDWSCFLDLIHQIPKDEEAVSVEVHNDNLDLIWCGIQILSLILKVSSRHDDHKHKHEGVPIRIAQWSKLLSNVLEGVGETDAREETSISLFRWRTFCVDVSLEKAGWYVEPLGRNTCNADVVASTSSSAQYLTTGSELLSGSQLSRIKPTICNRRLSKCSIGEDTVADPFVMTSSLEKSVEMIVLAMSQKWPVLLHGPSGSGKTALLNRLAKMTGNQVLSIHMDEQADAKMLIGSYVCTEQPGEFRWQPGSLTQAILNGFWVIFEDIDKAPMDVHCILLPLLEGASSFITGNGEVIRVSEGFRLISNITTAKLDASISAKGWNSLSPLWRRVLVGPPNAKDMQKIVEAWYPNLFHLSGKIVETFENVNSHHAGGAHKNSISKVSFRDLLKWCKRIAVLNFNFVEKDLSADHCIYQEAVDIFAAFPSSSSGRLRIMKIIAMTWNVSSFATESIYPPNKPLLKDYPSETKVGRITLPRVTLQQMRTSSHEKKKPFVEIRSSIHTLERIAVSVKFNEPVLLVGETGTGKTTLVQNLAERLGQKLNVLNLSQQTDVADLLGGFKPMDAQFVCFPLYKDFEALFSKTFSVKVNPEYLTQLQKHLSDKNWRMLLIGFQKGVEYYKKLYEAEKTKPGKKRKKLLDEQLYRAWEDFVMKLNGALRQTSTSSGMLFSFVEGAFVTALQNGEWILLDEVNLAPPETLQRVIGVLEGERGSFCLAERGDINYVYRHPNFRIFACMNPATDAGKRDLPHSLRSRFTEYYVDEVLDDDDLNLFISQFTDVTVNRESIKHFYKEAKKASEEKLQDGANQKPQYSLRSLYRALEYTRKGNAVFGSRNPSLPLYDGFAMFFLTLLDRDSSKLMEHLIMKHLLPGKKAPPHEDFESYLEHLSCGKNHKSDGFSETYVLTKSVREHLRNLARAVLIRRYPVLLQGPTSSGKTSLVQYLAAITGREFVRINNHEHTDLQEYLGSYITDASGKLVFQEGALVKAVRSGHWIVLDELNLAPSDVLEALNRLLDDNRELYVPELCETVKAHPDFMLFATQNPPTFYGGRKMLSRAFRNRFVEIHVDDMPDNELSNILHIRCKIPESYAEKMIEVMKKLQLHRQTSKVFAGRHGFITPRDLFRWANRFRELGISYEDLAKDGYFLLGDRIRDESEKKVVQDALQKCLLKQNTDFFQVTDDFYQQKSPSLFSSITWTKSMRRLYFLVERCFKLREPVLLVGETGGGKTTVCQLLSSVFGSRLHILNCHQYTETSDFLGGFRPVRERSKLSSEYSFIVEHLLKANALGHFPTIGPISSDIGQASSTLDQLDVIIDSYKQGLASCPDMSGEVLELLMHKKHELAELHQKWQTIFIWEDGPLVQAMRDGDFLLVDEISLADDSVLERLNSVLEPERKLSLAEKGGSSLETVTAHHNFFILATMNPGGDYGKKELSPALRNRFTEIWVPPVNDLIDLRSISLQRLSNPELSSIVAPIINFWEWFNKLHLPRTLTIRDLLSWVDFINVTSKSLRPDFALIHGAFLVLLDGICLGTGISNVEAEKVREQCVSYLTDQLKLDIGINFDDNLTHMQNYGWGNLDNGVQTSYDTDMEDQSHFGIAPFFIEKGCENCEHGRFMLSAPTTRRNASRVLRAMQLPKPVLLEGSPGVGKTSLIDAIGKLSGHKVVRINLSEQTDIMDLLGSDLPVDSNDEIKFAWSDGILLQAIKNGCWVLLDELNLAPQSVLEGLNAILDHRAEVYIPELGLTFKCPATFRVFACQNPSSQGGGRKNLPKSFLNRFTKVYIDELNDYDYLCICRSLHPSIPGDLLEKLIFFNKRLYEDTMLHHNFARNGSPWEFNLRDVLRACQLIEGSVEDFKSSCFLNVIYVQRMRTSIDRREVLHLYEHVFGEKPSINPYPRVQITPQYLMVGSITIKRNHFQSYKTSKNQLKILPDIRHCLEAAAQCVKYERLCIIVGPPSSGKTTLIRLLAQLTGNVLHEINLSPASDISELLGCFEQYNAVRTFRSLISQVECYISEYCNLQLQSSWATLIEEKKELVSKWFTIISTIKLWESTESSSYVDELKSYSDSLCLLVQIVEEIQLSYAKQSSYMEVSPASTSFVGIDGIKRTILKLQQNLDQGTQPAKFEWVTGLLVKAIEQGNWIILENANLCNPTVLDRINSLLEQGGSITINECGSVDGKPLIIHPHPNFRMFLTVDPSFGEVSRAMRNRGIEIFMMQPYWLFDEAGGYRSDAAELEDVSRFLVLAGIPVRTLVDVMAKAHIYAKDQGLHLNVHLTYHELALWVQLFQQLISKGNQFTWSLQTSWEHTYISSLGVADGINFVELGKQQFLSGEKLSGISLASSSSLQMPGGWPAPLLLREFVLYSEGASVLQNCMYLEHLAVEYALLESNICRSNLFAHKNVGTSYLVDMKTLHQIMFPGFSLSMTDAPSESQITYDLSLAKEKVFFAFNWTIEQATEVDLELHIRWISRVSFQLHPFCQCIKSFLKIMRQLLNHKIWKDILRYRKMNSFKQSLGQFLRYIPMLSPEVPSSMEVCAPSSTSSSLLVHAIKCQDLLRLSVCQWNDEDEHVFGEKMRPYVPLLELLKALEEVMLDQLLKSALDKLFSLYTDLLEGHILFWNGLKSSHFEYISISLTSLNKTALKIHAIFPSADISESHITKVMAAIKEVCDLYLVNFRSSKSLLWKHGGHPLLPSSPNVYYAQRKYLDLCYLIWPRHRNVLSMANGNQFVDLAVSFIPELRTLAMHGLCMSSCIMELGGDSCRQLGEMQQMLLERVNHEKLKISTNVHGSNSSAIPSCCDSSLEILRSKSSFISFLEAVPVIDNRSLFFDMELLQELSAIVLFDTGTAQQALSRVSQLIETALTFSMGSSSRPPTDYVPHQKILWTLDASMSSDLAFERVTSFVQDMWFTWHSHIWSCLPSFVENILSTGIQSPPLPHILLQPIRALVNTHILQSTTAVKDYSVHCLKLRLASRNLWHASQSSVHLPKFLLSVARSLFKQIIYAHKKTFDADIYLELKSCLDLCGKAGGVTTDDIQVLLSKIKSSADLASSVTYIEPLLNELYLQSPAIGYLYNLGCAWLHIGALRFHLVLSEGVIDPALKYAFKYSRLLERIRSLEAEIKVCHECNYLAGIFMSRQSDQRKESALKVLRVELDRVKRKIVFRSDPRKFKKLKDECVEFRNLVGSSLVLISNIKYADMGKVHNWQETATSFIDRISSEYAAYADLIQPIQVAVYEMKLGLSLVESSVNQMKLLRNVGRDNLDEVEEVMYSSVQYPRYSAFKSNSIALVGYELFSYGVDLTTSYWGTRRSLLEKVVKETLKLKIEDKGSILHVEAAINLDSVMRITQAVASSHLLDRASFKEMNFIFEWFANLWIRMKEEAKFKDVYEAQQFRFRPRALKTESIFEFDESSLGIFSSNETYQEWQAFISRDDSSETKEARDKHDTPEDNWAMIPDYILMKLVYIHNQLFGSVDLFQNHGVVCLSDSDSLHSFIDSYTLGVGVVKDLGGLSSALLDAKLAPEHILRLSLDINQQFVLPHKNASPYNFYKDPNISAVARLVEVVTSLQQRIIILGKEWDEHPGLQKLLEITEILLALPLKTPLDKALSGLQFLLNRIQILQENGSKFPLSDHVKQITDLASAWKKLEFDSWPFLIDEVQVQCENNAANMWFPLYALLQPKDSVITEEYLKSTTKSLEEFVQMSSIGEFKRRLQLLLAFHVQISRGLDLEWYCSPATPIENLMKVLYNILGYYLQFLPAILERINIHKESVQKELDELLKLCKWEHPESYLSPVNSKRVREKLKKFIQKYTDVLQQPVMVILRQEEIRLGINTESPYLPNVDAALLCKNKMVDASANINQFEEGSCSWFEECRRNAISCLQHISDKDFTLQAEQYPENMNIVWSILKNLFSTAEEYGDLWNDSHAKKYQKRKAWKDFLDLLESRGLSKHKSVFLEDSWFLQPSYNANHLLMKSNKKSSEDNSTSNQSEVIPATDLDEWKKANQYHFKSLASVELLRQIRLKFHPDFDLEKVKQSVSYLDHLIMIQLEQRQSAYSFAEQVRNLEKCLLALRNLITPSPDSITDREVGFVPQQQETVLCMWQQKHIFDRLCTMMGEMDLLLKTTDNSHLHTCQHVKPWTGELSKFIQKLISNCRNSKDTLDRFLLGEQRGIASVGGSQKFLSIISKQNSEDMIKKNFVALREIEESLSSFREKCETRSSIEWILLSHFYDIFNEAKAVEEQFESAEKGKGLVEAANYESYHKVEQNFRNSFEKTLHQAEAATVALGCLMNEDCLAETSSDNVVHSLDEKKKTVDSIPDWTSVLGSYISNLQLNELSGNLLKTVSVAGNLVKHHENKSITASSEVGRNLKMLEQMFDNILKFSDGVLRDFLEIHKTVCALSHFISNILASLYSKGFGSSDEQEDTSKDADQDAKGTGMGEGVGANDVSDQLTDEDQLLGTLKQQEEQDDTKADPGKNDKGIEMEEDFAADTFSVSEDSGDDSENHDNDEEQLNSAMGEAGTESAVVDEKLWDENKDEEPTNAEKYETGSSVKDQTVNSEELRAKDDSGTAPSDDGSKDLDPATGDERDVRDEDQADLEETDNVEDVTMDKDEAFAEPTGLDIDDNNHEPDKDMDLDQQDDGCPTEEAENEDECQEGAERQEENMNEMEAASEDGIDGNSEMENIETMGKDDDMDVDVLNQDVSKTRSTLPEKFDLQALGSGNTQELNMPNNCDINNDLAPTESLPSTGASDNEIMMADASEKGRPTNDKADVQFSEQNTSKTQKNQPNPYRNVTDALKEWKERAKVVADTEADKDNLDEMMEDDADEYGYVPEAEMGTAQALGAATSDQIDKNVNGSKPPDESLTAHEENTTETESGQKPVDSNSVQSGIAIHRNKEEEPTKSTSFDEPTNNGSLEVQNQCNDIEGPIDSQVTVNRSFMDSGTQKLKELSLREEEPQEAKNLELVSNDVKDDAVKQWRKFELRTTGLSQELAEQLRLVMEPTLASKLQGDYKTGKRINMKKVIPYIASQYRKDKIWLRRTKPNKRDYQVVIAIDDSQSMGENSCDEVAIEALVTVCSAMSQLEVGSLAVASFGTKGNVKLLHDFDQPFSGEAGAKMISNLTFEQDNIAGGEDPVVDLLRYLNNMLDNAAVTARLPSGQNPLQQLVLIIADGHITDKPNVRRMVRDAMSRRRLIAFLLLDNPNESIMDRLECVYQKEGASYPKYMDSFPFPYYIVLEDIKSLPRTLADLLRQWFELTQLTGD